MIKLKKLQELKGITERYPLILLDTCIFSDYYEEGKEGLTWEFTKFQKFIINSIESAPLFITPFVKKEYTPSFRRYKKKIQEENGNSQEHTQTERLKEEYLRLTNCFELSKRILEFNDEEAQQYIPLYNQYYSFSPNLSKTDLDLATSGVVVSTTKGKCAIFSNDLGILHLLQSYVQKGENKKIVDTTKGLGFFIRAEGNQFKQMSIC